MEVPIFKRTVHSVLYAFHHLLHDLVFPKHSLFAQIPKQGMGILAYPHAATPRTIPGFYHHRIGRDCRQVCLLYLHSLKKQPYRNTTQSLLSHLLMKLPFIRAVSCAFFRNTVKPVMVIGFPCCR